MSEATAQTFFPSTCSRYRFVAAGSMLHILIAKISPTIEPLPAMQNGRAAVMAAPPAGRGTLLAYETGPAKSPSVVVERR